MTDGQVLVLHDMLGIPADGFMPRYVKRYGEIGRMMADAVERYASEVRYHEFPGPEHVYSMDDDQVAAFEEAIGAGSIDGNSLADW